MKVSWISGKIIKVKNLHAHLEPKMDIAIRSKEQNLSYEEHSFDKNYNVNKLTR